MKMSLFIYPFIPFKFKYYPFFSTVKCSVLLTPLRTNYYFKKRNINSKRSKENSSKVDQRAIERYKQRKLQMLVIFFNKVLFMLAVNCKPRDPENMFQSQLESIFCPLVLSLFPNANLHLELSLVDVQIPM